MRAPRPVSWGRALALAALCLAFAAPPASAFDNSGWGVLDAGRLGDYQWTVKAKREGGPAVAGARTPRPPCLMVAVQRRLGLFNVQRIRFRTCADRGAARLAATDAPLIASGTLLTSGPDPDLSAVGVVVAPAVRALRVELAGGGWRTIPVNRLTPKQTSRTGLGRVRYAAFSVRGQWEAKRVVALSRSGRVLWEGGDSAP